MTKRKSQLFSTYTFSSSTLTLAFLDFDLVPISFFLDLAVFLFFFAFLCLTSQRREQGWMQ